MKLPRRKFLHLAAGAAALPFAPHVARAQVYPSRPVRIVVGFPPGGGYDFTARLIGQWLSERLGQQFVIENRPGAAGNIATETVTRAAPDGYTLLLVGTPQAISVTLYDKLNFDFAHDIVPVAGVVGGPQIMALHPSVPAKTIPEFIAYAKANPGKLNFASSGIGGTPHVAGELFKTMAGVNLVHVPYRGGGPAISDLLGGQVQLSFATLASSIEFVRAGRLYGMAVTTKTRSESLPNIPTIGEFLPGYESSDWFGLAAPRGVPPEIINKLNNEVNAGLADPKIKARLVDLGGLSLAGTPAEFGKLIANDIEKWGRVIRTANIKAE